MQVTVRRGQRGIFYQPSGTRRSSLFNTSSENLENEKMNPRVVTPGLKMTW